MADAAQYSIQRQYEILLFHYHWIVPRLGPAPDADGRPKWVSRMAQDCSPIEYAWKWNTATSKPQISYSWEALNPGSESCQDPKNHRLSLQYMNDVRRVVPHADFTVSRFFLEAIENGTRKPSNFLHAIDHGSERLELKSYLLVRDESTMNEWHDAITKLDPENPAHHALKGFLTENPEGRLFSPIVLAWDNVTPSKSRLKWYFVTRNTSFKSVREIMTMGGRLDVTEDNLQDLRSLITAILELPADYPEDQNFPLPPPAAKTWSEQENQAETFAYYFDIAPRNGIKPDVKIYLPTRSYGPNDLAIAHHLVDWMRARGRGAYGDQYLAMLKRICDHRQLENGKGIHSYITYQFGKNGVPDVKSYLISETYHPARFHKTQE
ncbi:aromatic prenyltransferase [Stachybotrys elegans]|uniref:Aromatic prenyltransferase n=1 Tax=Stachybotrys elegans TaxID=80388 RepID=A0A8K0WTU1_9HYPO|nr:aromatic prenyltransferase [Stachybotrys elegans]